MATVPTPATQVAGTAVPAATVNSQGNLATYLAGRVESGGARRPLCVMRQTVAQALAAGGSTALTFDAEDVDYDNGHSTVTNTSRYTAGTAGWHHIDYIASMSAGAAGSRQTYLRVNGVTAVTASSVLINTAGQVAGSRLIFLNVGDYVELMANSAAAINTDVTAQSASSMCVEWRSV